MSQDKPRVNCDCSNSWKGFRPAPIEVFHGEAMEQFHRGARFPINETFVNGIRFMNGVEVNVILAAFKTKIMKEYGITSDAIPIEPTPDTEEIK